MKRLICKYPLIGAFAMSLVMCNAVVVGLVTLVTEPVAFVWTSDEPDATVLRYAMLVVANLFMAPLFILPMYQCVGQFQLALDCLHAKRLGKR